MNYLSAVRYSAKRYHFDIPAGLENARLVSLIFDSREFPDLALQTPLAGGSQLYTFGCHGAARRLHGPEIPDMPCGSIVYLVLDNEMLQYMIRGKPGPRARARALNAVTAPAPIPLPIHVIAPAPIHWPVGFGDDEPGEPQVVPRPAVPSAFVPVADEPDNERDLLEELHVAGAYHVPDDLVREWGSALIRSSELTDTGACRTASFWALLRTLMIASLVATWTPPSTLNSVHHTIEELESAGWVSSHIPNPMNKLNLQCLDL